MTSLRMSPLTWPWYALLESEFSYSGQWSSSFSMISPTLFSLMLAVVQSSSVGELSMTKLMTCLHKFSEYEYFFSNILQIAMFISWKRKFLIGEKKDFLSVLSIWTTVTQNLVEKICRFLFFKFVKLCLEPWPLKWANPDTRYEI